MAKMFYTMDEARAALGRTEDEIRALTKEGKLREFRDGPRLMFKADQVEALKGALPSKDTIDIADSGAPLSLADSASGTGGAMSIKDDTGMPDLGLSSSGSRAASRSGTGTGMNMFSDDEGADPSAATAITPASESGNLEAVGSGSGLLDLTRESDDTSLGAVLDEITPGGKRDAGASRAGSGAGVPIAAMSSGSPAQRSAPVLISKPDPTSPFFGGLALGGAVLSLFALFVLAAAVVGSRVSLVDQLVASGGFLIVAAVFAGVVIVCGGIGFGLGKIVK